MSGVQVRGNLKARPDGKFDDRLAATIGERLIALEKASRAGGSTIVAPAVPALVAPARPVLVSAASGVTDHGLLAGLEDDDHPQYVYRVERVPPAPHPHLVADVADLRPDDAQFVLASRVFGG